MVTRQRSARRPRRSGQEPEGMPGRSSDDRGEIVGVWAGCTGECAAAAAAAAAERWKRGLRSWNTIPRQRDLTRHLPRAATAGNGSLDEEQGFASAGALSQAVMMMMAGERRAAGMDPQRK